MASSFTPNNWSRQGSFNGPAITDTTIDGLTVETGLFCCDHHRDALSVDEKKFCVPTIHFLLGLCRPSTISRLVISVIVDAVDGVRRSCPWAEVGIKNRETLPSIANRNPPTSIVLVIATRWVLATLAHMAPYFVFRRAAQAVRSLCGFGSFSMETSARLRQTSCEILQVDVFRTAAITQALDVSVAATIKGFSDDQKSAEFQSENVLSFSHVPLVSVAYFMVPQ